MASSNAATPSISAHAGSTGDTIHNATASSITPKKCFTRSIHPPARGNKEPADRPTSNKGTLMPEASENSAAPPSTTFLVWLM